MKVGENALAPKMWAKSYHFQTSHYYFAPELLLRDRAAAPCLPAGKCLWDSLFWPCGRRALGLAGAGSASTDAKTTTARTFTDVSSRAEAATGHNCVCACSQLVQR